MSTIKFFKNNLVEQSPLALDKASLARMLSYFDKKVYPSKNDIFVPGQPADTFYYVISGTLAVISAETPKSNISSSSKNQTKDSSVKEKELVLNYVSAGEFVGELGMFCPTDVRHVSMRTRTTCEIAEISYDRFISLLQNELFPESPKILYSMGVSLSKRLLSISRKASSLAFVDVTERIYRTVLELAMQSDALTHPQGMQIKASRQELAKLSGCSREMAGRALKELERDGKLTAHGKTIVVFGTR